MFHIRLNLPCCLVILYFRATITLFIAVEGALKQDNFSTVSKKKPINPSSYKLTIFYKKY